MKNWFKALTENTWMTRMLIAYLAMQLLTLVIHSPLLFLLYEVSFLSAIYLAVRWIYVKYKTEKQWKPLGVSIVFFLLVNLVLFLVYVPTLLLNPEINWALKGDTGEADPMILLAYFPLIHFIGALLVMALSGVVIKLTVK